jgi:hypothetical protein
VIADCFFSDAAVFRDFVVTFLSRQRMHQRRFDRALFVLICATQPVRLICAEAIPNLRRR